jgi:hypothetical protein
MSSYQVMEISGITVLQPYRPCHPAWVDEYIIKLTNILMPHLDQSLSLFLHHTFLYELRRHLLLNEASAPAIADYQNTRVHAAHSPSQISFNGVLIRSNASTHAMVHIVAKHCCGYEASRRAFEMMSAL